MNAISRYLDKQAFTSNLLLHPGDELALIVVIPCKSEPELAKTIFSLEKAARGTEHQIEIIIVLNDHDRDKDEIVQQNLKTKEWLQTASFQLPVHILHPSKITYKKSGVGYARKKGMDEAIHRFNLINRPDGIICSMDADTLVSENYFRELIYAFKELKVDCLVIHFEHLLDGLLLHHRKAIVLYELHLRYYIEALRWAGFPHAYQTLGSAIAVTASAYAAQGGMPPKQAGEDFYFIQKFAKLNRVAELNSITVYPSARISDRVPFGTGKAIGDMINSGREWGITYPLRAFTDLKMVLDSVDKLYTMQWQKVEMPESVFAFLNAIQFDKIQIELQSNTSDYEHFLKRFFQKMDAFIMMKFIHFARDQFYGPDKVVASASELLDLKYNLKIPGSDPEKLLEEYRAIQKNSKIVK